MFRSSTILRELVQSLVKAIFMLKHSVKLRRCILCGDVAACCHIFTQYTGVPLAAEPGREEI